MWGLRSALLPVAATTNMCDELVIDFLLYRLGILDDCIEVQKPDYVWHWHQAMEQLQKLTV
jgi:hypothetical protein